MPIITTLILLAVACTTASALIELQSLWYAKKAAELEWSYQFEEADEGDD